MHMIYVWFFIFFVNGLYLFPVSSQIPLYQVMKILAQDTWNAGDKLPPLV